MRDATTALKTESATLDGVGYSKVSRKTFDSAITSAFYASKQTTGVKHAVPADTKTDAMDAIIQSNLKQMHKFVNSSSPVGPVGSVGAVGPTGKVGVATPKAVATQPAIPKPAIPASPPVKVKRITP